MEKGKARKQTCQKCRMHGIISPLKGHKRSCPFANCVCSSCVLIVQKRKVSKEQIALRRRQSEEEAAGVSLPVPEHILYGKGGNTVLATNLRALSQMFPKVRFGRLHAVLKETDTLKQAIARLQREELTQDHQRWAVATNSMPPSSPSSSVPSSSLGVRPPPSPATTKTEMFPNDYCTSRYYPQPPLYNALHMYSIPSYCKPGSTPNPYCTNCDTGDLQPQATSQFLLPQSNPSAWSFSDVSSYALGMADSSKNISEYSSLPSENNTAGSMSPGQAASASATFPNPSPNPMSSDDEGNLMIDVDHCTGV